MTQLIAQDLVSRTQFIFISASTTLIHPTASQIEPPVPRRSHIPDHASTRRNRRARERLRFDTLQHIFHESVEKMLDLFLFLLAAGRAAHNGWPGLGRA
jgi:hypothetical protein